MGGEMGPRLSRELISNIFLIEFEYLSDLLDSAGDDSMGEAANKCTGQPAIDRKHGITFEQDEIDRGNLFLGLERRGSKSVQINY